MTMTGKIALEAHGLLLAIGGAMKGRADKPNPPDLFLASLHDQGYDVVRLVDEPVTDQASHGPRANGDVRATSSALGLG